MVDAKKRTWALELLRALDVPTDILPPLVEPGTVLGALKVSACAALAGTPVVLPACHDTGSAVAAAPMTPTRAYLSSGTWSLLGVEVPEPVITTRALEANFTNEGGVFGTTRLLKNVAGLWLLQACRRAWARDGREYAYPELMAAAADDRPAFASLFDPDDPRFLHPPDMLQAIADYCRGTGQREPDTPGSYVRAILESLALKYRMVTRHARRAHRRSHRGDSDHRGRVAEPAAESVHRRCDGPAARCRASRSDRARQRRRADGGDWSRAIDHGGAAGDRAVLSGGTGRAARSGSLA